MSRAGRIARLAFWVAALAVPLLRQGHDIQIGGRTLSSILGLFVLLGVAGRFVANAKKAVRDPACRTRAALLGIILLEGVLYVFHLGRLAAVANVGVAALEFSVLGLVVVRLLRSKPRPGMLPEDRIADALGTVAPPLLARIVAVECVVIGAALTAPFMRPRPDGASFGYAETNTWKELLPVLPILGVLDFVTVEALLPKGLPWLHAIFALSTVYGLFWGVGAYALLRRRPHRIDGESLYMYQGILRSARVPLAGIESVRLLGDGPPSPGAVRLDVSGVARLELRLRTPVTPMGLFGPLPESDLIVSCADDPPALQHALLLATGVSP